LTDSLLAVIERRDGHRWTWPSEVGSGNRHKHILPHNDRLRPHNDRLREVGGVLFDQQRMAPWDILTVQKHAHAWIPKT
jgi:hypothetical protein